MSNIQIIEHLAVYAVSWIAIIVAFALVIFVIWSIVAIITYRHQVKRHNQMIQKYKRGRGLL